MALKRPPTIPIFISSLSLTHHFCDLLLMELCTVQASLKFPNNHVLYLPIPSGSHLLPKSPFSLRQAPLIRTAGNMLSLTFGSTNLTYVLPRATTSDESAGGASQFVDEKLDGAIIVEDVKTADDNGLNGFVATEETKEESPVDELVQPFDFAEKLNNIKFDTDDTGSILLYGGGAIIALWLASAVVGAIDSIPLVPKLLEVVGLSYSLWFTWRYLLFKKNRDELGTKIEEFKEQVLGSEDD